MAETVLLAIGTRKGLWLATSQDRRRWDVTGPHLPMTEMYAVAIDTRSRPRLLVGATHQHYGPSVVVSDDLGVSWREPEHAPVRFPDDTETALERVWQLAPGPEGEPDVVYAGAEPSALFRSEDGGRTYEFVRGLWEHPHRQHWVPGGGRKAVHSILPHPRQHQEIIIAMSTGGVYRSEDGGKTWSASNRGIRVSFQPDEYPEFGQCVHKIARDSARPDHYYLQNHGGVYRSTDGARSWQSIAEGLPSDFGFPMVTHPRRGDVVYGFPLTADARRFPPDGRCRVYRSRDAGHSWSASSGGLPDQFWSGVMRDALCVDDAEPAGVYFGARSGEVYASRDEGETWSQVVTHLPDVLSVRAARV